MKRDGWWHKPLLIVLAAAVLAGLIYVDRRARVSRAERDAVLEQTAPLEMRRDALIQKRDLRAREVREQIRPPATEQLLFLELDPRLSAEVLPALRERELTGVLGLGEANMPGDPDRLSREDFDLLLDAGWELCLVYEGERDFDQWDRDMTERLAATGIPKPAALYFGEDCYDPALDARIAAGGYTLAVHHGESGLPLIAEDAGNSLWFPGAHPWNYEGVRSQIQTVVNHRGEHCFTLRFSQGREEYSASSFENMLNFIQPFLDAGELRVTGFVQARDLHDPERSGAAQLLRDWEQEQQEMDRQIRELDGQIQALYALWNGEKDD